MEAPIDAFKNSLRDTGFIHRLQSESAVLPSVKTTPPFDASSPLRVHRPDPSRYAGSTPTAVRQN
jgi:hypothetical protein